MNNLTESSSISVKPDKDRLINIIDDIYLGKIKVPVFQRDWTWKPQQMLELFDSISKGYPVGSLLLWKPEKTFKTKELIGPYRIDKNSNDVSYVLDGFQRLTTLFGSLTNPKKFEEDKKESLRDFTIFYNLRNKEFTHGRGLSSNPDYLIPLYKIIDTFEFLDFLRELESNPKIDQGELSKLIQNAKEISKIFYDYEIPYVEIYRGDIGSAVTIFSRINSTGSEISEDFMLSALSYNHNTDFLLSERISEFINELNVYNFSNIKRDTILDCVSNSTGKIHFDVKVEDLLKLDLEEVTQRVFVHVHKAIKFLYSELKIIDVRLLPYPNQLVFISEFFRLNASPSSEELDKLKNWFWITTYSNYFTIYSLSQQREAYSIFKKFAEGNHSDGILKTTDLFEIVEFPSKLNFTGVRPKALQLFLLNFTYRDIKFGEGETLKEMYIFNKKDKDPGNIVLMTTSDFQSLEDRTFGGLKNEKIWHSCDQYILNDEIMDYYEKGLDNRFVSSRRELITHEELDFLNQNYRNYFNISQKGYLDNLGV